MKALDFVKTSEGHIAIITETNDGGNKASIKYIGKTPRNGKSAWWSEKELEVVDSLPRFLAENLSHPFGSGKQDVERFFSNKEEK